RRQVWPDRVSYALELMAGRTMLPEEQLSPLGEARHRHDRLELLHDLLPAGIACHRQQSASALGAFGFGVSGEPLPRERVELRWKNLFSRHPLQELLGPRRAAQQHLNHLRS